VRTEVRYRSGRFIDTQPSPRIRWLLAVFARSSASIERSVLSYRRERGYRSRHRAIALLQSRREYEPRESHSPISVWMLGRAIFGPAGEQASRPCIKNFTRFAAGHQAIISALGRLLKIAHEFLLDRVPCRGLILIIQVPVDLGRTGVPDLFPAVEIPLLSDQQSALLVDQKDCLVAVDVCRLLVKDIDEHRIPFHRFGPGPAAFWIDSHLRRTSRRRSPGVSSVFAIEPRLTEGRHPCLRSPAAR